MFSSKIPSVGVISIKSCFQPNAQSNPTHDPSWATAQSRSPTQLCSTHLPHLIHASPHMTCSPTCLRHSGGSCEEIFLPKSAHRGYFFPARELPVHNPRAICAPPKAYEPPKSAHRGYFFRWFSCAQVRDSPVQYPGRIMPARYRYRAHYAHRDTVRADLCAHHPGRRNSYLPTHMTPTYTGHTYKPIMSRGNPPKPT